MAAPELESVFVAEAVWRVGFHPTPWAWGGWEWASNGRFHGRRDDLEGNFRTVYAGSSLLGCLLEVLACFRKEPRLAIDLADIAEDDEDRDFHPSLAPGTVPVEWLDGRTAATAMMTGTFCAVTTAESVAALYPHFIGMALGMGLKDFDAAALKDAKPRALTQAVASNIYATGKFDGVQFASRHGDDVRLWAIFERPGDPSISPRLGLMANQELHPDSSDILEAFRLLGLAWQGKQPIRVH